MCVGWIHFKIINIDPGDLQMSDSHLVEECTVNTIYYKYIENKKKL